MNRSWRQFVYQSVYLLILVVVASSPAICATENKPAAQESSVPEASSDPVDLKQGNNSWTEAFLPAFWQDVLAIVGGVGVLLTGLGVLLAWKQMKKTVSANAAATEAAIEAINESRSHYNKYVIAQSSRLLTEARIHVKSREWPIATLRLSDLADLLIQMAGDDESWSKMIIRLNKMENSFDDIYKNEITFSDSLKGKWNKLDRELRVKIGEKFGPFSDEN